MQAAIVQGGHELTVSVGDTINMFSSSYKNLAKALPACTSHLKTATHLRSSTSLRCRSMKPAAWNRKAGCGGVSDGGAADRLFKVVANRTEDGTLSPFSAAPFHTQTPNISKATMECELCTPAHTNMYTVTGLAKTINGPTFKGQHAAGAVRSLACA